MASCWPVRVAFLLCLPWLSVEARGASTPLKLQKVAGGLKDPVLVTAVPGDPTRLFVAEQNSGRIRIIRDGAVVTHDFLGLFAKITNGGERGLLGLAFHPNHLANGFLYVYYTDLNGDAVVERYRVDLAHPDIALGSTAKLILKIPQVLIQHKAGMLQFGPDGYLYIGVGDGGGGYDPLENAQDLGTLAGKILRIDVDAAFPYAIPQSNPFVGQPGVREEIYAYGLRNPWRFGIDSATGDVYVGDVGQESREEIDLIPSGGGGGLNFGWPCNEGDLCWEFLPNCDCPAPGTAPLYSYSHDVGCAVMGGQVYRGSAIPDLQGTYFFADYCTGKIYSFRNVGGAVVDFQDRTAELQPPEGDSLLLISGFGLDAAGELYVVDFLEDEIYKIVPDLNPGNDCNGNAIADACEIENGTAFDVDGDGILDSCEHQLTVDPLYLEKNATVRFIGANPGETVFFTFTLAGIGQGPCLPAASGKCFDLLAPLYLLGNFAAGAQGAAQFPIFVPPATPLIDVCFQALLYRGQDGVDSVLSNAVLESVVPQPGP